MENTDNKYPNKISSKEFIAGQIGAKASENFANATDAMIEDMDVFWKVFQTTGNNPYKHGNLFECIEAAKFNVDSAIKRAEFKAQVTAQPNSPNVSAAPHAPADINIVNESGEVAREVQAKCMESPSQTAFEIKNPKYSGMQRTVPTDKEPRIHELVDKRAESGSINAEDYKDAGDNLSNATKHGGVSSGGTSYKEAVFAKNNPRLYTAMMETKQVAVEAGVAGAQAAAAGAVIGAGISSIKNVYATYRGEKSKKAAVIDIIKDGASAGKKSGAIGAGGAIIRYTAQKAGINYLTKSNAATAMAAGVIDAGVTVYSLAKGEITFEEAMERFGQTGVSVSYGLFAGAVAGTILSGPAAAVIATSAGYLLANIAYQSCITVFKEAKLAEEQAAKVVVLCEASIAMMQKQRAEFEQRLSEELQIRNHEFSQCFDLIENSLSSDNPSETANAFANFTGLLGKKLKFEKFEEFDEFMINSADPLVI